MSIFTPKLVIRSEYSFLTKLGIVLNWLFLFYFVLFLALFWIMPHFISKTYETNLFSVFDYTHDSKHTKNAEQILKRVENRLKDNRLYDPQVRISVFVINDYLYRFFVIYDWLGDNSFAATFNETVLIHRIDFDKNLAYGYLSNNKNNYESLENTIEHEAIHSLQFNKYGFLRVRFMPEWIREGYPVYSTFDTSIRAKKINPERFLKNIKSKLSSWEKYYLYGLMAKHAIEDMHISVDDLHRGKVSYDEVMKSLLDKYGIEQDSKSEK